MFTNIFLILVGGSLLFLMAYSFYLVLFSKSDKASSKQPNIAESQIAKQHHQKAKPKVSRAQQYLLRIEFNKCQFLFIE